MIGQVRDDWWWYALYLVLAIAGVLAQGRGVSAMKLGMREQWASSTGARAA